MEVSVHVHEQLRTNLYLLQENKTLVALLARGRALVQSLQLNSTDAAKADSPLMQVG